MSPTLLIAVILAYFGILLAVARHASRGASAESFFHGNKNSNWVVVAFGMIGTSLSGVTFVSVPGLVGDTGFFYFQVMIGQFAGYLVVAYVLLPIFYRHKLTSIYAYLGTRLGPNSRIAGAWLFLVSRSIGASARLYLVIIILQVSVLDRLGVSYWVTAAATVCLIVAYTFQGGVKAIIWTDLLQTVLMLTGLVVCSLYLADALELSLPASYARMEAAGLAAIWSHDTDSVYFWLKQLLAGVLISVAMTGMDQEMMQKNISVKSLADSQKNIVSLAVVMLFVVFAFLFLGGLLTMFAQQNALAVSGDRLFPEVVFHHMPEVLQIVFVVALISALFPSADGALTALTASYCIDIAKIDLRKEAGEPWSERRRLVFRRQVQIAFAVLIFVLLAVLKLIDSASIVGLILKFATITYGPLLGLFCFAIATRRVLDDSRVLWVVIAVPGACLALDLAQPWLFAHYRIGLEMLAINGLLTFLGLLCISSAPAGPAAVTVPAAGASA